MRVRAGFRAVVAIALLALGVTTASAQTSSSPVMERIDKSRTLRVGMTGSQAPFNFKNRDGEMMGMDVDLANLLASSMVVKLEIVEMPFVKLLPALEDGEVDIVMSGVTATLQRNMRVPFVGPYHITGTSILTKSDVLSKVETAAQMNDEGLSIAVLRGSTSEDFVERVLDKPTLTTTATPDEALKMLLDGKVDAVVADASACALGKLRYPDAGLVSLRNPLTIEPIGIAVAPGDPLLLNLIENYMQALQATGARDKLQKKWFENGGWLVQLP